MINFSDYNIISIGDHCAIPMILKELNLRKKSYPFDWVTNKDQLYDTNIIYNIEIIHELKSCDNIDTIVHKYIGNAFENDKTNTINNINFPHDNEINITDIFEKYKRRFDRLKTDLNKKNIFMLVTRHYYIEQYIFQKIQDELLEYNKDSIIFFISGTNHTYFEKMKYPNVIFIYIKYDISKFSDYDYFEFRPKIKQILSHFLL